MARKEDTRQNDQRGRGGRNQQLVLAALEEVWRRAASSSTARNDPEETPPDPFRGMVILSGGTDGEDGPTDA